MYVEANGKDRAGEYTTDLISDDEEITSQIPTSTDVTSKVFWNYVNPLLGTTNVIPAHSVPDKIDERFSRAEGAKTNVDITVAIDTTVEIGGYKNQLLFTAIANPNPITYSLIYEGNLPSGSSLSDLEGLPENESFETVATTYTFTIPDAAPTLRGYSFENYLGSDNNTHNPGESVTLGSENPRLVLLANWGVESFPLTVNPNGGIWNDDVSPQTFIQEYGSTRAIGDPSAGSRYTISYDDNGQGATFSDEPTSVSRGFTQWTLTGVGSFAGGVYTFSDGAGTLTANYNSESNVFKLPVISKLGSTCKWAEGSASGTQFDGGTSRTITSNITFFAVCVANSYELTVKPEGGVWEGSSDDQSFTQLYGTTKNISNPTNPKYTISYDDNGQGASFVGTPIATERPFEGWTRSGYGDLVGEVFTFGAGDGTLTANYNIISKTFTLPAISKEGYICKWAEGSSSGSQYDGGTERTIASNITYYAKCAIQHYNLTVRPNGGVWNGSTADRVFTQDYGTTKEIIDPSAGTKYSISYNGNGQGAEYTGSPTEVLRPFDHWDFAGAGSFVNGVYTFGEGNGEITAQYGSTSVGFTLPIILKTGHTCTWHLNSATGTEYASGAENVTISGNAEFFAVCTTNPYTLTIRPNGGKWNNKTTNSTVTQNYGTTFAVSDATDGPTYTISYDGNSQEASYVGTPTSVVRPFAGWSKSGTGTWDTENKIWTYGEGNGTLTANWSTTSNTFNLPVITKTGHTCGWGTSSSSGIEYESGATNITISGNTTFFAACNVRQYNVTLNRGTGIASVSGAGAKDYGSTVTIGATSGAGYHFSSWTVNSGGVTINNNQFTMPANAVNITANGAINTCTIRYNANAPSGTSVSGSTADSSFDYNTKTPTTENGFAITGYVWSGWAESSTGTAIITNSGDAITAEQAASWCGTHGTVKNFYAKWTKKFNYTLNLNANDGTTNKQVLNSPNNTNTSHTFSNLNNYAPSRSGYTFLGWATSSTGTSYVTSYTLNSSSASSTPTSEGFPVTGNLYAIWGDPTYTITVNASTGATVSKGQGGPWSSSVELTFKDDDIYKNFFIKTDTGYVFDQIGNCGQGYSCSGGTPGQSGTIAIDVAGTSGSMWTGYMTAQVLPYMQNQTAVNTCKNGSTHATYSFYDSRDNNKYTAAKLRDGNCWMTQNLRLTGPRRLTGGDTDFTDKNYWDLPAQNTNTWCSDFMSSSCVNTANHISSGDSSYGTYYNWYAATAGSGTYSLLSNEAEGSICPKGWRLPTGKDNDGFKALVAEYDSGSLIRNPPANFLLSGLWYYGQGQFQNEAGYYWSSTATDSEYYAKHLQLNEQSAWVTYNWDKTSGLSVRCVAR